MKLRAATLLGILGAWMAVAGPKVAPTSGEALTIEGRIGPGALYGIYVPAEWNGTLVLYSHGIVDPAEPIQLPYKDQAEELRDAVLAEGFAVAYSSYSENGFAVKDGAQRTKQLRGIFVSKVGQPEKTYLMGHSLGGLSAIMLAEKHPELFDGALLISAPLGGAQYEVDYIANVRALFDVFYPGVLPGCMTEPPAGLNPQTDILPCLMDCFVPELIAWAGDPMAIPGFVLISYTLQTPLFCEFSNPVEIITGYTWALGFHARFFDDVLARTHGAFPADNLGTVYSCLIPGTQGIMDQVNAVVERSGTTPDAANYLEHYYEPTGDIRIPVLTLHNRRDPAVPVVHEGLYWRKVKAMGNTDNLHQWILPTWGHVGFTVEGTVCALRTLAYWEQTGIRPPEVD